jgi:hypothetical protein
VRQLYSPDRSIPAVVNGICCRLDELHQLFRPDQMTKDIPAGIIDRERRLNRLVELKSKVMLTPKSMTQFNALSKYSNDTSANYRESAGMHPPISKNDHSNSK